MQKMILLISLVLCLVFPVSVFSAQSTKDVTASDSMKVEERQKVMGSEVAKTPADPEYVIGHGDFLEIRIYGEGSMSVSAPAPGFDDLEVEVQRSSDDGIQVRIDGRISLKHIGDVDAVGMTLTQLADYLKALYSTVFDDPIVTVVLNRSNSKRYTVMGKVVNPGIFLLEFPLNLVQVIARCGGFTEWANSEMTVVRNNGSKGSSLFKGNTLKFDYDDFLDGKKLERNIVIQSGDIIIVH